MNQTKFEAEVKGSGGKLLSEKTSNLLKGFGGFFAIVLTNIYWLIVIIIFIGGRSLELKKLLFYMFFSILLLLCYSGVTTKTVKSSITYKILQIIKRFFDVVIAASAIFISGPILILFAIAVRVESPGPIIFRSKRVGQFGTMIDTYRFRTMYIAPAEIPITRIGGFLRRSTLNNLPMLFNVLNGELSLVGPWPRWPEILAETIDKDKKILNVRPGMTGLMQISDTPLEQLVELELKYIENWSLWLDLKILIKTPFVAFHMEKRS